MTNTDTLTQYRADREAGDWPAQHGVLRAVVRGLFENDPTMRGIWRDLARELIAVWDAESQHGPQARADD